MTIDNNEAGLKGTDYRDLQTRTKDPTAWEDMPQEEEAYLQSRLHWERKHDPDVTIAGRS